MMSEVEKTKLRWEKADEADLTSAITALLSAPNGRRFLWWLLAVGKIGNQPFSPDPYVAAFNCGALDVGNQIMARLMETDPDNYTAMQKEMLNERRNRDTELGLASDTDQRNNVAGDGRDYGDEPRYPGVDGDAG